MAPIACGLDVLQGELVISLGYLLPTMCIVKSQLLELLDRPTPLTICQPLVRALLDGIDRRFGAAFDDTKAQLAAVVPKFKLDWIENPVQKALIVDQLKRVVKKEHQTMEQQQGCTSSAKSHQVQTMTGNLPPKDFFACLTSRRNNTVTKPDADAEVDSYLADPSVELSSLAAYSNIHRVHVQLNTGLPSSAAVERLFSLGGRVFTPLRSRLNSEHFEMMMFLRTAKNW